MRLETNDERTCAEMDEEVRRRTLNASRTNLNSEVLNISPFLFFLLRSSPAFARARQHLPRCVGVVLQVLCFYGGEREYKGRKAGKEVSNVHSAT